jgi:hypothetical protein
MLPIFYDLGLFTVRHAELFMSKMAIQQFVTLSLLAALWLFSSCHAEPAEARQLLSAYGLLFVCRLTLNCVP